MKRLLSLLIILGLLIGPALADQSSVVIPAGPITGIDFHTKTNAALQALISNNSGPSEPTTKYAYMLWADTGSSPKLLKVRNSTNDAWLTIGPVETANLGLALVASLQNSGYTSGTATGSSGAYALTVSPAITAYATRQVFGFTANHAAPGASTLAVSGLTATNILKFDASGALVALVAADIPNNKIVWVYYDTTASAFVLLNPAPLGDVTQVNLQKQAYTAAAAGGTVDAITATFSPAVTLTNNTRVCVLAAGANTSATPTFAPNSLTAHTIVRGSNQVLRAGDIPGANAHLDLIYNSTLTAWVLLNPALPAIYPALATPLSTFATSDTTLTSANTYYPILSLTPPAGSYRLTAQILVDGGGRNTTFKLWDGTTAYDCAGGNPTNSYYGQVVLEADVTTAGATTYYVSAAAATAGTVIIRATPSANATGLTNLGTKMRALRIQ